MTSCIGEPVSYFRLERYGLHELPAEEDRSVAAHLEQCAVCRACYERIQADARDSDIAAIAAQLSQLPAARPRRARALWGLTALAASVACLLFVLRPQPAVPGIASESTTKGDGFALELVRADADGQLLEPTHFVPGDRFKLLLTCPASSAGSVRVLMFQGGASYEPVAAQRLDTCGNRRPLAGAWGLDGLEAVELCAVFADASLDVSALRTGDQLSAPHVCVRVSPAAIGR
ncbi:MAG TPA: hypothetical protein VFN67_04315 [Polyangiales bacterium]|nr:hypothetical protein [Polyangiales bacterium]